MAVTAGSTQFTGKLSSRASLKQGGNVPSLNARYMGGGSYSLKTSSGKDVQVTSGTASKNIQALAKAVSSGVLRPAAAERAAETVQASSMQIPKEIRKLDVQIKSSPESSAQRAQLQMDRTRLFNTFYETTRIQPGVVRTGLGAIVVTEGKGVKAGEVFRQFAPLRTIDRVSSVGVGTGSIPRLDKSKIQVSRVVEPPKPVIPYIQPSGKYLTMSASPKPVDTTPPSSKDNIIKRFASGWISGTEKVSDSLGINTIQSKAEKLAKENPIYTPKGAGERTIVGFIGGAKAVSNLIPGLVILGSNILYELPRTQYELGKSLVEKPIETAVTLGSSGYFATKAITFGMDIGTRFGSKQVPAIAASASETGFAKEVLSGKETFVRSGGVVEQLREAAASFGKPVIKGQGSKLVAFEGVVPEIPAGFSWFTEEPTVRGTHASTVSRSGGVSSFMKGSVKAGSSEQEGMYLGPQSRTNVRYLDVMPSNAIESSSGGSISVLPSRPFVVSVDVGKVSRPPASALRSSEALNRWLSKQVGKGEAYTTLKSEGSGGETEWVISKGSRIEMIPPYEGSKLGVMKGYDLYANVAGRPIPFYRFRLLGEGEKSTSVSISGEQYLQLEKQSRASLSSIGKTDTNVLSLSVVPLSGSQLTSKLALSSPLSSGLYSLTPMTYSLLYLRGSKSGVSSSGGSVSRVTLPTTLISSSDVSKPVSSIFVGSSSGGVSRGSSVPPSSPSSPVPSPGTSFPSPVIPSFSVPPSSPSKLFTGSGSGVGSGSSFVPNYPKFKRGDVSELKSKKKTKAYSVLIKRNKKFKKIFTDLPKNVAIEYGAREARRSLAATFKVVPEGTTAMQDVREPFLGGFRSYAVRKGMRVPLVDTYIQKRPLRLSSRTERKEIVQSRRSKSSRWFV